MHLLVLGNRERLNLGAQLSARLAYLAGSRSLRDYHEDGE